MSHVELIFSAEGNTPRDVQFAALVRSFPVLADCPDELLLPRFQPFKFDDWVISIAHEEYAVVAAGAFIVNLWSNRNAYKCGSFDAIEAIASWDWGQRHAFAAWAADPWQP